MGTAGSLANLLRNAWPNQ